MLTTQFLEKCRNMVKQKKHLSKLMDSWWSLCQKKGLQSWEDGRRFCVTVQKNAQVKTQELFISGPFQNSFASR